MRINPSIYSGKPFQCLSAVLLQVIEVCHCKSNMVKTKQTKSPPVLPGQPGSARNLPDYHGKYFILNIHSKLNTVYVKEVERNKNTYTCCVLTHVEGSKEIKIHVHVVCLLMSKGLKVPVQNVIVLK